MSATPSDLKPPPDHVPLFTEGRATWSGRRRRKMSRFSRTDAGVVGSSSSTAAAVQHATGAAAHATKSTAAAVQHATGAAAHATKNNRAAGNESIIGAQDSKRRCKGESYTLGLLRECLQKEEIRLRLMDNRTRFILAVILGEMCIGGRSKADIVAELEYACYDKMPIHKDGSEETFTGHVKSAQQGFKEGTISYDYLLDMPISWLSIEKLQDLQEQADIQAARVSRAQAALTPELSEPEMEAALAECHAEIARQAAKQQKCRAMWRDGSMHEEGLEKKKEETVTPGDCQDQPLPGVQNAKEGLEAAAKLEEEESPPWTGPPPELLVMNPCCLQRWGEGWLLPLRTGALLRDDTVQVLLTSTVQPKTIVHEASLGALMQLVTAAPDHRPPSIYTQTPASPQPSWQDDPPRPVPLPVPPLQPEPLHPPQQQSALLGAPFRPLAPLHWPPQPPRPFMPATPAPLPNPQQPPGPFMAGTRRFVPPPRPPPYEPPWPPPYVKPRLPSYAPTWPPFS